MCMSFLVKPQSEVLLAVMPATACIVVIVLLVKGNQNSLKLRKFWVLECANVYDCMNVLQLQYNKAHIISSFFAFKYIGFYVLTFRKWVISHPPWWQRGMGIKNQFQIGQSIKILRLWVYPFIDAQACDDDGTKKVKLNCDSLWTAYSAHTRFIFGYLVIHLKKRQWLQALLDLMRK